MDRSVIGLFDSVSEAQRALNELVQAGFARDHISLVAHDASGQYSKYLKKDGSFDPEGDVTADEGAGFGAAVGAITGVLASLGALAIPGIGPVIAAGPLLAAVTGGTIGAVAGAATGGMTAALIKTGLPEDEAQYYTEGVRRGGTLLVVDTDSDAKAQRAVDIMDRYGAVDVNQRAQEWKQSGWKYSENAQPYTADQLKSFRSTSQTSMSSSMPSSTTNKQTQTNKTQEGKQVLPVVEEKLDVSKRQVEKGGVRVNTRIVEKPVSEQVTLHEEHVNVERRPVDRPVNASDMSAFKEGSIEMRETAEEAVVNKQARVIEEIVIDKHSHDRQQTINDTVRRTEVDVQQLGGQQSSSANSFDMYNNDFRTHFTSRYGKSGYNYDQYSPAYRYGYNLASNQSYSGDWSTYEPDIRSRWEERNQGTWEDFKDAIRYAWDKVRGKPASASR